MNMLNTYKHTHTDTHSHIFLMSCAMEGSKRRWAWLKKTRSVIADLTNILTDGKLYPGLPKTKAS